MSYLHPSWDVADRVKSISSTRVGGFSSDDFASLNLGMHVNDDPVIVQRNREHLAELSKMPSPPVWMNQTHSTTVVELTEPTSETIEADALVTSVPGVVCSVMTADCLPVLFASVDGTKVASVHAGWRGLVGGILENTLSHFTSPVIAWVGPAISLDAFEVGDEVRQQFVDSNGGDVIAFHQHKPGKWMADLPLLAKLRLQRAGCHDVTLSGLCTYSDSERFFSYRRQASTGRQSSFIWIE
ncbi:multi-copper polyphenol oxidoreductase [Vibrio breoganii]|uniref:Purine nucleoside phosphorylase n=1 Tax=Vibrio breoganii TaxID=553239 RepID=A0AAN1CRF8_9VIBR|nr:peptidoglycan editing factor PgeF [Vibrio breoganii]ANO32149.1 multi-copper polyphenol oxidoreductase [Vibrio breoganii]OED85026.1 multi-copper polyphenol oxidoreductase [Vibrio breoganii ZF-55]PMK47505.1 multi-copper polyphenol oxidoreductase [Vibrio breoganii]PML04380.1 multi-copper polyphenol oxidoreductase [Vibrio breoganii]PMO32836.1 multi-copper polyphenol oxidoreductase [Vibrio breoganii]